MGAFILLSNILITFYRLLAESGQTIDNAQAGITAVSLATSYMQLAQGLHFDEVTIDSFVTRTQVTNLTPPANLGRDNNYGPDTTGPTPWPENAGIHYFDDIDDFNRWRDTTLSRTLGNYVAAFSVYYVKPDSIEVRSTVQTFVKRMDISIWRLFPPSADTLRTSMIMGYWMFSTAF